MRQIAVLLVTATFGVATVQPAAAGTTDANRVARADAFERAGKLDEAFGQLAALAKPTKAQRAHRAHVRTAAGALIAAAALTKLKDDAAAKKALDTALAELDPGGDAVIRAKLAEESAAAAERASAAVAAARAPANKQAEATLQKGDALGRDERWQDAAAMYKSVATKPAGEIDAAIRQRATTKQLAAEKEAVEAEPGALREFGDTVWHGIRDVIAWLLVPLILLGLLFGVLIAVHAALWRRPRPGIQLAVVDASDAMKDRNGRDEALAAALLDAIEDVRSGSWAAGGSEIDERRDLDGMAPPPVAAGAGSSGLDDLKDKVEIGAGGVKVSPVAFVAPLVRYLTRPHERELRGMLRADADSTELCLALYDIGRPSKAEGEDPVAEKKAPSGPWGASRTGAGSRAKVLREVAQKFVTESGYSYITTSWRSYAAYRDGLVALAAADELPAAEREAMLHEARAAFQRAVNGDQDNLLARMRLAGVRRMLGDNPEAAAEFRQVLDDVLDPDRLSPHAKSLVKAHPELIYLAAINRTVSLDKWHDRDRFAVSEDLAFLVRKLAVAKDELPEVQLPDTTPEFVGDDRWPKEPLEGPDRLRLLVTAFAAWAASLLRTVGREDRGASLDDVRRRLDKVCRWIVKVDSRDPSVGLARRQAEGTLRNAIARVAYDQGCLKKAQEDFDGARGSWDEARHEAEQALVLSPQLGDANVTLAQVAMERRNQNWSSEAARHLQRALEVSPKDGRARFRLGELYREIGEDEAAIAQFGLLKDDARALHRIGVIHKENDDYQQAVPFLALSQVRGPSKGRRAVDLVKAVILLREDPNGWMLKHDGNVAEDAAKRLVPVDGTDEEKAAANRLVGEVIAAVKQLTEVRQRPVAGVAPAAVEGNSAVPPTHAAAS
ncbi:MAG: tetratricopeptide repeat protein [Baekduia sp.]